ncbi:hypothetical protein [Lacunimicrobium album]
MTIASPAAAKLRIWPIFAVVMVMFLAWVSFMGWMAASYANRPRINEAQLHQAQLVILGTVEAIGISRRDGDANVPTYQVGVKEVFKNSIDLEVPRAVIVIGEEGRECDFQKDYIFAISEAEHSEFSLVSAPFGGKKKDVPLSLDNWGYVVTPDVDGFGTKIIYPDEPEVRAQIEAFLKAETPSAAP